MAQPTNTFSSYDQVGIREDLVDAIYMLDTAETPVLSMLERVSATSTKHEWQEDSLAAAANQESSPNAVIEGDDVTADSVSATTRLFNYTQLMDKAPRVTSTGRAVDTAGRADEMDYQKYKKSKELKKDIETAIMANNAYVAGNDTTAREMAGIPNYVVNNIDKASDATAATGDGTDAWTFGTARALTEAQLKSVVRQAWDDGGQPSVIIANSFNRQQISTKFDGGSTHVVKSEDKKSVATIKIYESDFGELTIMADRHAKTNVCYVLDPDYLALAVLQDFTFEPLSKTGHSDIELLSWEGTLEVRNRLAQGLITDLTTS